MTFSCPINYFLCAHKRKTGCKFGQLVLQFLVSVTLETVLILTLVPDKINHTSVITALLYWKLLIKEKCVELSLRSMAVLSSRAQERRKELGIYSVRIQSVCEKICQSTRSNYDDYWYRFEYLD